MRIAANHIVGISFAETLCLFTSSDVFLFGISAKKSPVSRDIGEINCAALFLRFASHLPAVAAGFGTFPPLSGRLSDFFGPVPSVTLDKMFFLLFFLLCYFVLLFFCFIISS